MSRAATVSPRRPVAAAAIALLILAATAAGAEAPGVNPAPPLPNPTPAPAGPADRIAGRGPGLRWRIFELHARTIGRWFSEQEDGVNQLAAGNDTRSEWDAEDARIELRIRHGRWLRAVAEYDFASGRPWKDAYLALRPGRFEIRTGNFKPPISGIELGSRWELPASERGLLSEILIGSFGIAGYRPGLQVRWDRGGRGLAATAAVTRASSVRGDRIGDESFDNLARDWEALKGTARLEWQGRRLDLGASFDVRTAEPLPSEGYERLWAASVDAGWRTTRRRGLRLWAEGFVGSSWQDSNAFDGRHARFLAGRLHLAWRSSDRNTNQLYGEPFLMAAAFDPDASIRDDLLWEASAGVQLGGWRHLRLVLEAQHRQVARNAPLSLGLFARGEAAERSRTRLLAQFGAAF